MQAVLSYPATETSAALLDGSLCLTLSWDGEPFYLGPFKDEREMAAAKRLAIEPAEGTG